MCAIQQTDSAPLHFSKMSMLTRLTCGAFQRFRSRFSSARFSAQSVKIHRQQRRSMTRVAAMATATHCPRILTKTTSKCSEASSPSFLQRRFATSSEAAPGDDVEGETTVSSKTFHRVADATLDLFTEHLEVRHSSICAI